MALLCLLLVCSTWACGPRIQPRSMIVWWAVLVSNQRPLPCEGRTDRFFRFPPFASPRLPHRENLKNVTLGFACVRPLVVRYFVRYFTSPLPSMACSLDRVDARTKLPPRRAPYTQRLAEGRQLGFRRLTASSPGSWLAI